MSEKTRNSGGGPGVMVAAPAARAEPVRLAIPADRDFVIVVRAVAARLGVRVGLSVAEIEDFRLAVDEACGLFLTGRAARGPTLACEFTELPAATGSAASGGALAVTVSGTVYGDFAEEQVGTFGWTLLQSLVDGLWWSADRGRARVRLLKRHRAIPPQARRHTSRS